MEAHPGNRPRIMVVSHERSGTHFMMNALAADGVYIANPWINLDFQTGLNLHAPRVIAQVFAQYAKKPALNLVKSHHQLAFFEPVLDGILEDFRIVYMVRHPATLMPSLMRYLNAWAWDEGPRCANPSELIRAEPSGAMLRYQKRQVPNMVARWRAHVEPWIAAAARRPGIAVVRYEDLDSAFEATMASLKAQLGLPPGPSARPDASREVVLPNAAREAGGHAWTEADLGFIRREGGDALAQLYPDGPEGA